MNETTIIIIIIIIIINALFILSVPTQLLIQAATRGFFFLAIKRPKPEADDAPLPTVEVKHSKPSW
jgi:hypothetical protein